MTILSPSRIHKDIQSKMPFKTWLSNTESTYQNKVNSGEISKNVPFMYWLNLQYKDGVLNADGSILDNLTKIVSDSVKMVTTTPNEQEIIEKEPQKATTILGLRKPVFYSIALVSLLGISTVIYLKYKKYKKS